MPLGSGWLLPMIMFKSSQPQIFLVSQARWVVFNLWNKHLTDQESVGSHWQVDGGGQPQVQAIRAYIVCREFQDNNKTTNQSAFNYLSAPAILTNVYDKTLLKIYIYLHPMGPSFKQLLWLLLSFNNIYLSFKLDIFITYPLINIVFYMEFNLKNHLL